MIKYTQLTLDSDQDMEDVPSEFDPVCITNGALYNTQKYHPNKTIAALPHSIKQKNDKNTTIGPFLQKTQQYMASRLKKIKDIKQQQQNRVMADCTFKPQINKTPTKSPRNLQQFIESQQKHLSKISEKKQQLKQRLEEETKKNMTFSPSINKKKNQRNKENVHCRLYKAKNKEKEEKYYQQQYTHIPTINKRGGDIARTLPVNQLLYQDAKRRTERYYNVPQPLAAQVAKNPIQQKYAAQKFLRDFKASLEATNLKQKVTYDQEELITILRELGFARYSAHDNNALAISEKQLLHESYQYLQQVGVTQINVYVFLLAMGGIYNVDLNNEEIHSAIVIDDIEGKKIHQYFDLLFRNRLFMNASSKSPRNIYKEQSPFKPDISPQSKKMAVKYRGKMIDRTNSIFEENNIDIKLPENGLSHQDLLVIYSLGKNLQKERLMQAKKKEKDPECTFQPNAQKYPQQFISNRISQDKCRQLYEEARVRQDEFSKLPTFRSDQNQANHFKPSQRSSVSPLKKDKSTHSIKSNVKSYLQIKDVDKMLSRMVLGRKQRTEKLQFEQRGQKCYKNKQPKNNHNYGLDCRSEEEDDLLLDADILVNNVKQKIYIYRQDENRIEQVVNQFAAEHNLDCYSRDMLYERLIEALENLQNDQS